MDDDLERQFEESVKRLNKLSATSAVTLELLDTLSDDDIAYAVFSSLENGRLAKNITSTVEYSEQLPPGPRMVYTAQLVDIDVPNGGFVQLFWNQDSRIVELAIGAFELMGAPKTAQLVSRALARFREEQELHARQRATGSLQGFSDTYSLSKLGEFDVEYWEHVDHHRDLIVRYIRAHPEEFVTET